MKAICQDKYGSPDVLELRDVDKPSPGADGVLVRVRASSVNALDWHIMRGQPYVMRVTSLRRPEVALRGVDVAGVVEAVGSDVTDLRPGDEVFGVADGAFAEWVAGKAINYVAKPASLSFEQAAALPVAGITALQGLRDKGQVRAGQTVLVTGAGGGVGTFAVQIARALGAQVTATTSPQNLELVRSLGAERVLDYTREDLAEGDRRYDVIFDVAASQPLSRLVRALAPEGRLVLAGGAKGRWAGPILRFVAGVLRSRLRGQRIVPFMAKIGREDLLALAALVETGKVHPVIDRTFPLRDAAEAMRYVETGRARGKVVITI
jgi:NADPH:quinone reductase-like Zn-dependent oxidoreductase